MKKQTLLTLGLVTLVAFSTRAGQEQLAASIKETRIEATSTANQLKTTLASLNALTSQKKGDLRPAYDVFKQEVPRTENAAAVTRRRAEMMTQDSGKYFDSWQKTIDQISNKSLQKKAQKRRDSVKKSYGKVETSMTEAADKFRPFLSDLSDVNKTLSQDVTEGGVKAAKGTVRDANWHYKDVSSSIDGALKNLEKMEKALSGIAD